MFIREYQSLVRLVFFTNYFFLVWLRYTEDNQTEIGSENELFLFFLKMLQVYNKVDQISIEEVDRLASQQNSVVISCGMKLNLDYLLEQLWEYLALICLYTKKRGGKV